MEATALPVLAFVVFGLAFVCGLAMFGCLYVLTRRLGMAWSVNGWSAEPDTREAPRLFKLLWGFERVEPKLRGLLWAVRGFWVAMTLLVLTFAAMVAGII
jgi:hypothetical protein